MDAYDVVDWRRRVFALYAAVRAESDPAAAHARWRRGRDELFATHPATPLLPEDRDGFDGLTVAAYDPAWRFEVEVEPAEPTTWEVETGTDGVVPFERIGAVTLPDVGTLDVWRLTTYGGGVFVPMRDGGCGRPGRRVRRRALPAGHGQGRRPGRRRRPAGRGPQLRLRAVVRLRPGVGLPARAGRQPGGGRRPGG